MALGFTALPTACKLWKSYWQEHNELLAGIMQGNTRQISIHEALLVSLAIYPRPVVAMHILPLHGPVALCLTSYNPDYVCHQASSMPLTSFAHDLLAHFL